MVPVARSEAMGLHGGPFRRARSARREA
jgi:hypothetical protein